MILSGPEILRIVNKEQTFDATRADCQRRIYISPFTKSQLNPNSYNLRLAPELLVYSGSRELDMAREEPTHQFEIDPVHGFVINPGMLYLGSTVERIETHGIVPCIEGRSSVGRLGLSVHATAGVGDDGFSGQFVLELSAVQPLRIYAGVEICQVLFFEMVGERKPYVGKYQGQSGPVPSGLWRDFLRKKKQ